MIVVMYPECILIRGNRMIPPPIMPFTIPITVAVSPIPYPTFASLNGYTSSMFIILNGSHQYQEKSRRPENIDSNNFKISEKINM